MLLRRKVAKISLVMLKIFYFAWALVAIIFLRDILWARLDFALTAMGSGCNLIALFSNDGRMPVHVPPRTLLREQEWHQRMTAETKLKPLCDIHRALGCSWSLGDLIVLFSSVLGLLGAAAFWMGKFLQR